MTFIEKILKRLAHIQNDYPIIILSLFLIFTIIMAFGVAKIEFNGNMDEEMPKHLEVYKLRDRIKDKFAGQDVIFILLQLDESLEMRDTPIDIRDPKIMSYVSDLHNALNKESSVISVTSLGPFIDILEAQGDPTLESISEFISASGGDAFVSRNYKMTFLMVRADVGSGQDKIIDLTELIDEKIRALSTPPGTKISVTGTPPLISAILDLLKKDAVNTLILASLIIFLLLLLMQRSFYKSVLIFTPIILSLIWTMGTMGYTGLMINVATAGLGAMILGLGVEYGVFILSRYEEERDKGANQRDSILVAVPGVGSAIVGSGSTTIVGFLALTISIMPMLQHLGQSLALGIFYCIIGAVVVEPALILFAERIEHWNLERQHLKIEKKKKKLARRAL